MDWICTTEWLNITLCSYTLLVWINDETESATLSSILHWKSERQVLLPFCPTKGYRQEPYHESPGMSAVCDRHAAWSCIDQWIDLKHSKWIYTYNHVICICILWFCVLLVSVVLCRSCRRIFLHIHLLCTWVRGCMCILYNYYMFMCVCAHVKL